MCPPGRPEGDVEGEDREHQGAHRGVPPYPHEGLRDVAPPGATRSRGSLGSRGEHDPRDQERPQRDDDGVTRVIAGVGYFLYTRLVTRPRRMTLRERIQPREISEPEGPAVDSYTGDPL